MVPSAPDLLQANLLQHVLSTGISVPTFPSTSPQFERVWCFSKHAAGQLAYIIHIYIYIYHPHSTNKLQTSYDSHKSSFFVTNHLHIPFSFWSCWIRLIAQLGNRFILSRQRTFWSQLDSQCHNRFIFSFDWLLIFTLCFHTQLFRFKAKRAWYQCICDIQYSVSWQFHVMRFPPFSWHPWFPPVSRLPVGPYNSAKEPKDPGRSGPAS